MKQVFTEKGVVVAEMDSQEARAVGGIIEDLPVGYKVKISDIKYQHDILFIECSRYVKPGFRLVRR